MKQTETKQDLDAVLAQMAEEVPPMPADFHARWTNAVRAEAQKAAPAAEEPAEPKAVFPVRWTRILSAAAAFLFLIGGTLLYRNSRNVPDAAFQAQERKAAFTAGGTEDAAGAAEAAESNEDAGVPMVMFSAPVAYMANEADTAEAAETVSAAAEEEEAEAEEAAEEPALPTEEPEEEETKEENSFLREAGRFFTDMGDFLLAALPYLLVLAVPAAATLMIRKRGKK